MMAEPSISTTTQNIIIIVHAIMVFIGLFGTMFSEPGITQRNIPKDMYLPGKLKLPKPLKKENDKFIKIAYELLSM